MTTTNVDMLLSTRLLKTSYFAFTGTDFAHKINSSHYALLLCLATRAEFTVEAARWMKPSAIATCCFGISANRTRHLLGELSVWGLVISKPAIFNTGREFTLNTENVLHILDEAAAARQNADAPYKRSDRGGCLNESLRQA